VHKKRTYRDLSKIKNLESFEVSVKETDLWICAKKELKSEARDLILKARGYLESYIESNPQFLKTLLPWRISTPVPLIVNEMAEAGLKSDVGPMAAVAGAIAEFVGKGLMAFSEEIIVENGGDIFIKLNQPFTYGIYAGESPLSMQFGIRIDAIKAPIGVCTSSATIGHSLSTGKADAVSVISNSCALADAAATSICNRVGSEKQIQQAIDYGKSIQGVSGIIIIKGEKIGLWGNAEVVPL